MSNAEPHALACLEVWGGNGCIAREVTLPGLSAWIHSRPLPGSAAGGDVYYLSVCSQGALTRVSLADVSGHGQEVSQVAECLRELMRKHINSFHQSALLQDLNDSFQHQCLREVRFASIILVGIYNAPGSADSGKVVLSNAGQPPPLWYKAQEKEWRCLEPALVDTTLSDLPLGVLVGTNYHQSSVQLAPGDLLLIYSDGLPESRNPNGQLLGADGLMKLTQRLPTDTSTVTGEALLAAIEKFRGGFPIQDDETFFVLRQLGN